MFDNGLFVGIFLYLSASVVFGAEERIFTPGEYVQTYVENDENLRQAEIDLKTMEQELIKANDLYQSQLSLTPLLTHSQQEIPEAGFERYSRSLSVNGGVEQDLPTGTTFGLKTERVLNQNRNSIGLVDSSVSLTMEQSLWRNAFGRLFRLQVQKAENQKEEEALRLAWQRLQSCREALNLFLEAYQYQETYFLHQQLLEQARSALQKTRQNYRERLVRKIDFLSAQADEARAERLLENAQKNYRLKMVQLMNPLNQEVSFQNKTPSFRLNNPREPFGSMRPESPKILEKTPLMQALSENVKAQKAEWERVQESNKNKVNLGLELGQSQRSTNFKTLEVTDRTDQYARVSLTFDWPWWNRTQSAEQLQAQYEYQKAQAQLSKEQKQLRKSLKEALETRRSLEEQLKLSKKQLEIQQKQMKEASRLLKIGKMEFEDYLVYRDRLTNQKLTRSDLRTSLWKAVVSLEALNQREKSVCMGAQF